MADITGALVKELRDKTGVGMMDWSLEQALPKMRGKARRIVKEILANLDPHDADYGHRLLACPTCETLHNRYYLKVSWGDGKEYETLFHCGTCRTPFVEVNKPISEYRCRKCGSYALEEGGVMLWD